MPRQLEPAEALEPRQALVLPPEQRRLESGLLQLASARLDELRQRVSLHELPESRLLRVDAR
jgi:hypothetical protein